MSKINGYYTIIYFNEFLAWYKYGTRVCLTNSDFYIYANNKKIGDSAIAEKLENLINLFSFEEDYEVLIIYLVSDQGLKSQAQAYQAIKFESIQEIFSISERGYKMLLNGRLPVGLKLDRLPIDIEDRINNLLRVSQKNNLLRGANFLCSLAMGKEEKFDLHDENIFENIFDEELININSIYGAVTQSLEGSYDVSCPDNNKFLYSLFTYSRQNPKIPDSDYGFFFDLGAIIKNNFNQVEGASDILEQYKSDLNILLKQSPHIPALKIFDELSDSLSKLCNIDKILLEIPPACIIVYFVLKNNMYDKNYNPRSIFDKNFNFLYLKGIYCNSNLIKTNFYKASFLLGFYSGFDNFYKDYYRLSCNRSKDKFSIFNIVKIINQQLMLGF
ncbi:hypothetical protein [Synechocystis sp. PCC 7338]|uniref:hypothetical protein n=1 Tax=Synechocystis sp. PCC 7338 TaxID=2732530 RepID=UPI001BB019BE|nr:hypothetical protein [Synechocystis sp. PCC 7338]QUS61116.1 hypothetical protein HTZ78_10855 [Synechocystis sp. PCC 7338]